MGKGSKGKVPLTEIQKIFATKEQAKIVRPQGSFTALEFAEESNLSPGQVQRLLKRLVDSGDLVVCKIPVMMPNGYVALRPAYRLVKRSHSNGKK